MELIEKLELGYGLNELTKRPQSMGQNEAQFNIGWLLAQLVFYGPRYAVKAHKKPNVLRQAQG